MPDAPPVADSVAWPPTIPVPGPVKLIAGGVGRGGAVPTPVSTSE